MNNLFFNERVRIIKNGSTEFCNIPLDNRIYVMEDIDCNTDILLDRKFTSDLNDIDSKRDYSDHKYSFYANYEQYHGDIFSNQFSNFDNVNNNDKDINNINVLKSRLRSRGTDIKEIQSKKEIIDEDNNEKVTLSFILNLLDGILETPGRILIMTSNYPEKLDQALIRPGRIDINLKVGYCNNEMITQMFRYFFKHVDNIENFEFNSTINKDITPAQLNQILLNNFNNHLLANNEIIKFIS